MKQRIAVAISVIVTAISFALVPASASATSPGHLYETNNNTVYLTTDGTVPYGAAETGSSPGRDIYFINTGQTYNDPSGYCPSGGCPVYQLQLSSGYCIAPDNGYVFLEIRDCSNADTNWAITVSNNAYELIDRSASNAAGADQVMAGDKAKGDQMQLCGFTIGLSCFNNLYFRWDATDIILSN